jgi:hypothetical protein
MVRIVFLNGGDPVFLQDSKQKPTRATGIAFQENTVRVPGNLVEPWKERPLWAEAYLSKRSIMLVVNPDGSIPDAPNICWDQNLGIKKTKKAFDKKTQKGNMDAYEGWE